MSDLHVREASSEEWDGLVVELVEEGRVVGIAYLDGTTLLTEFGPDAEGDAWAFEVADLQVALDTASAMLSPEGTSLLVEEGAKDDDDNGDEQHPVDRLAEEFDDLAAHREDESCTTHDFDNF